MRRLLLVILLLMAGLTLSTSAHAAGPVVWVFGHSIPAGVGTSNGGWPVQYQRLTGTTVRVFAVGGATFVGGNIIDTQVRNALAQYPDERPDQVLVDAGTNDLVSYDDLTPVLWAVIGVDMLLQSRGVHGTFMTVLPMGYGTSHPDGWVPTLTVRAHRFNDWLRAMRAGGAFGVADMDGVLHEDPDGIMRSSSWLESDGLHLSNQGALLVAGSLP